MLMRLAEPGLTENRGGGIERYNRMKTITAIEPHLKYTKHRQYNILPFLYDVEGEIVFSRTGKIS